MQQEVEEEEEEEDRDGRLGGGDAKTLRENANPVGKPAPVPQELAVVVVLVLLVALLFALSLHRKELQKRERVGTVRLGVRVLQILLHLQDAGRRMPGEH